MCLLLNLVELNDNQDFQLILGVMNVEYFEDLFLEWATLREVIFITNASCDDAIKVAIVIQRS